jgi:hypothetical protein
MEMKMEKKKRKYTGYELYMMMERDFKKAMESQDIKEISEFTNKWGGVVWVED